MTTGDARPERPAHAAGEDPEQPGGGSRLARLGDTEPFFTIGQVSSLLEVPPATLRRLEDHQLVTPGRSAGGQRRYSREDVDRIEEVRTLTDEGITLPGVRRIFDLRQRISDLEHEVERLRDDRDAAAD